MGALRLRRYLAVFILTACTPAKSGGTDGGPGGGPPNASLNPNKITFKDITTDAMGMLISTGQRPDGTIVGNGAAVGDLNGDGLPDIVLARIDRTAEGVMSGGPSMLLINTSSGPGSITFKIDPKFSNLMKGKQPMGVTFGDYDKDGRLDIFFPCNGPDVLLHNDGNFKFTDVTNTAGVAGRNDDFSSFGVFADLNDDGLPDLYVANFEFLQLTDPCTVAQLRHRLFINLGDGTFADVSTQSKIDSCGATHTVGIADLDNDRVLDLWLGNDPQADDGMIPDFAQMMWKDNLYVRSSITNNGVPVYNDVAVDRGIQYPRATMGLGIADFDNDGFLEVYASASGADQFYKWNQDQMHYDEVAQQFACDIRYRGLDQPHPVPTVKWGAAPVDFDHDGAYEMYVVEGSLDEYPEMNLQLPDRFFQIPHLLRQPKVGDPFQDITDQTGLPHQIKIGDLSVAHSNRGAYISDFDQDGNLDILVGAYNENFLLYQNLTPQSDKLHFLRLRLNGTVSTQDPCGALVDVVMGDTTITRQLVCGGYTYGRTDLMIDLGIADKTIDAVTVHWPSGFDQHVEMLDNFGPDQEYTVTEPKFLTLSARAAKATDPPITLTYTPMNDKGAKIGTSASGKHVSIKRSDNVAVTVTDNHNGTYTAQFPHPGAAKRITLAITVDNKALPIHPMLTYK